MHHHPAIRVPSFFLPLFQLLILATYPTPGLSHPPLPYAIEVPIPPCTQTGWKSCSDLYCCPKGKECCYDAAVPWEGFCCGKGEMCMAKVNGNGVNCVDMLMEDVIVAGHRE